jgi:hypothetical protein
MNIYRHKHYDFNKNMMPIEFEYKDPQVFGLTPPDDDYELFTDQDYMDQFVAEKYAINEEEGRKYKNLISAKITNRVSSGLIPMEVANQYSIDIDNVRRYLSEGYWHSAYYADIDYIPPEEIQEIHDEIKNYIKEYVNEKYPSNFTII